jgi:putative DNA primase/helicase
MEVREAAMLMRRPTQVRTVRNSIDEQIQETAMEIRLDRGRRKYSSMDCGDGIIPTEPRWYTDIGNAEYFLESFGQNILYCKETKRWMVYSGRHWQVDDQYLVLGIARRFVKGELEAANQGRDESRRKNALRLNNDRGFNAMIKQASYQAVAPAAIFDAENSSYVVNFANGTLDLRTGALSKHNRKDFITRVINFDYDPTADCPNYEQFLTDVLPDPEVRAFVQRSIGYSLLGTSRERAFWILHGTGNNGKSIFIDLWNRLLGAYAASATSTSIMAMRPSSAIPNDIARMKGKRFVVIPETEENERINATLIKALSAGDTIAARFLFQEFFEFPFVGKLWIATNHLPKITDSSDGFWERLKIVPFSVDIPTEKIIKRDDLLSNLISEASGILAWAVRGYLEYYKQDSLGVPQSIRDGIEAYRYEQDSIIQFIDQCCLTITQMRERHQGNSPINVSAFYVSNGELFAACQKFYRNNGENPLTHPDFTRRLKERGFRQVNSRSKGGRVWEGLRLISDRC